MAEKSDIKVLLVDDEETQKALKKIQPFLQCIVLIFLSYLSS